MRAKSNTVRPLLATCQRDDLPAAEPGLLLALLVLDLEVAVIEVHGRRIGVAGMNNTADT